MKILKESLFEKFSEESDPIYDMGIGPEHIIKTYNHQIRAAFEKLKKEDRGYQHYDHDLDKWLDTKFFMYATIFKNSVPPELVLLFKRSFYDYHTQYYMTGTGKKIHEKDRIPYAKRLINLTELAQFLDIKNVKFGNTVSHIKFPIKPKFVTYFLKYEGS